MSTPACSSLHTLRLPKISYVGSYAFYGCTHLMSLYLLNSLVATGSAFILANTPMSNSGYTGSFGSIFVKESLLNSWKTATYWSAFSDRFVGLTDEEISTLPIDFII